MKKTKIIYVLLYFLLTCYFIFSINRDDNEIFLGEWIITKQISLCGITGLSTNEIKPFIGNKLTYDINKIRYNDSIICENPIYYKSIYSDDYHRKLTHNSHCKKGIELYELGIETDYVIEVLVDSNDNSKKRNYPYAQFLIRNKNEMIVIFHGVYIELKRINSD